MAQLFIPASTDNYEFETVVLGSVRLTRYLGSSTDVLIPSEYPVGSGNKVIELRDTFTGNTSITSVIIPRGIVALTDSVFAGCCALRHVYLPDSVMTISSQAFWGCNSLTVHCSASAARLLQINAIPAVREIEIVLHDSFSGINLGDMYHNGYGAETNPESAADWYARAGEFGNSSASHVLYCIIGTNKHNQPSDDSTYTPEPDMMFPGMGSDCDCAPVPMPEPDMCFPDMDCGYSPAPPMPAPAPSPSFTGHPQASKKESVKVTPVRCDKVSFSALSPEKVEKGTYSTISVFMYTKKQRKIVDKAIKAAKNSVAETTKSGFSVSRGSEVTVELCSDDVTVKDNRETREWNSSALTYDFMFLTPEDYSKKQIGFTCYVYFNGIQITRLNFAVSLRGDSKRVPVKVKRRDNRHVFVSYSHKDTQRVLAQLLGIQELAPKMTFWLDNQSLDTGDNWRREIRRAINKADGLFLFWSVYSKASPEVEKEWKYALKRKGLSFITPVPLDPPEMCPPPAELGSRHFGHRSFHYSEDMDKLNFRNSKRVKIIK